MILEDHATLWSGGEIDFPSFDNKVSILRIALRVALVDDTFVLNHCCGYVTSGYLVEVMWEVWRL